MLFLLQDECVARVGDPIVAASHILQRGFHPALSGNDLLPCCVKALRHRLGCLLTLLCHSQFLPRCQGAWVIGAPKFPA